MSAPDHDFTVRHPVDVRFRDIDVGGHAHHSQALIYFEEARATYWQEVVGRPAMDELDFVLAEVRVRYHQRIVYPARLVVGVRVSLLGKKHFEMTYRVEGSDGDALVSGESVQVMYDYEAGKSVAMPEGIRERIEAADGPFGRGGRPAGDDG